MSSSIHLLAVLCVTLIAVGQVLFKYAARALGSAGTFFDLGVMSIIVAALLLYGFATLVWIVLLQTAPLSRLYPYMALSFVLVAIASWLVFGEHLALGQMAGLGLIVAGLLVIAAAA